MHVERGGGFHKPTLRNFAPRGRLMVCGGSIEIMPHQTFVLVAEDEELVRLVIVQALLDEVSRYWKLSMPKLP
jgi:hypothetical protein